MSNSKGCAPLPLLLLHRKNLGNSVDNKVHGRNLPSLVNPRIRRPHSSFQRVVQGKCPLHFLNFNRAVCSNTLFSNTSALTSSLLFRGNSTCKILEHLVWSNTSGFQFWGPLARTNLLSALCGLPIGGKSIFADPQKIPLWGSPLFL